MTTTKMVTLVYGGGELEMHLRGFNLGAASRAERDLIAYVSDAMHAYEQRVSEEARRALERRPLPESLVGSMFRTKLDDWKKTCDHGVINCLECWPEQNTKP